MLTIIMWDVQHGSATYIKTPNDKHIIQDLGTGSYSGTSDFSPILHLKNRHGVSRVDLAIMSHPHRDHLDDIFNFSHVYPWQILRPKHLTEQDIRQGNPDPNDPIVKKYLEINAEYNTPVKDEDNVRLPENNGGVNIQCFIPTDSSRSNLNNHSVVLVITYIGCKVIIPGDNEPPSWRELLELSTFKEAIKDADIFVASHHGRESGYCSDIFTYFRPKLTLVSDGPFCDSSATSRYSSVSSGWKIHRRNGSSDERKCLTTRSDGVIVVKIWKEDDTRVINVTID